MSSRSHLDTGESCSFPPLFICFQGTYHPKMCGFLSVWRFPTFLCLPMNPAVGMIHGFLPSGPMPPFLLMPNYLSAIIVESFRLIFIIETELGVFTTDIWSLLLLLLLSDNNALFLHFFFLIFNYWDLFKDKNCSQA